MILGVDQGERERFQRRGEKTGPLSAQHGIAEISGLYRECHDPVPLNVAIRNRISEMRAQPTVPCTGGLGELSLNFTSFKLISLRFILLYFI
jgi:hypothetical protein